MWLGNRLVGVWLGQGLVGVWLGNGLVGVWLGKGLVGVWLGKGLVGVWLGKGLEGAWPVNGLEGVCGKGLEGGDISEVLRMVIPESELEESCRSLSCNRHSEFFVAVGCWLLSPLTLISTDPSY